MAEYDYIDAASDDGVVLGQTTSAKVAFWGITPVDQPDALTTALTTITLSASATATVSTYTTFTTAGMGFVDYSSAMSFVKAVQNLQIRSIDLEARLVESGILAGGTAAPAATLLAADFIGKGSDDGTILGQTSADKIGFWGILPCDQPAAVTGISTTSNLTVTVSVTTITATIRSLVTASVGFGPVDFEEGYSLLNVVKTLQTRTGEMEAALVEVGIVAGGTGISVTTSAKLEFLDNGNDTGTLLGYSTGQKIGFWGTTPADQPAALTQVINVYGAVTAGFTTIEVTTTASYTYAADIQGLTVGTVTGYKFVSVDEANTILHVVKKLWDRSKEFETALEELGLMAAN